MQTLVESSLLSSIEYLSDQTLELTFRSGATYRYSAVPEAVVEGFIAAESKGSYFNRHVRNCFPYQRQVVICPPGWGAPSPTSRRTRPR